MTVAQRRSVCFVCAHPDDMIASAAFAFRLAESGKYELHVIDLTRGEYGLPASSPAEVGKRRTQEEEQACALVGAKLHFLEEIDGHAYANEAVCKKLEALLRGIKPELIATHWPVDIHPDHVMCYAATMKAVRLAGIDPEICFYEESIQSRSMPIDYYVPFDEKIMQKKIELIRCYACQNAEDHMTKRKICEAQYHGWKCRREYAEPFAGIKPLRFRPDGILAEFTI